MTSERILVLGASGYLGRAIYNHFRSFTHTTGTFLTNSSQYVDLRYCDLHNLHSIIETLNSEEPSIIINATGYVDHMPFKQDSLNSYATHIQSMLNLCTACLSCSPPKLFINLSTADVYGSSMRPIHLRNELDITRPETLYALSRLHAENLYRQLALNLPMQILNLRLFLVYGPRQVSRLIPKLFEALSARAPFNIIHPNAERDFLYIDDFINCIDLAVRHHQNLHSDTYNVFTGIPVSIREVANSIASYYPSNINCITYHQEATSRSSMQSLVGDPTLISHQLGWSAHTSISQGIEYIHESLARRDYD